MPTLYVTIMPYVYEMEYFLTGLHAVWCLMPSVADGGIDTVRLIFNNELFSVYQVDGEVIDALQEAYSDERYAENGDSVDYGDYTDYGDFGDGDLETDEDTENRALEKKLDAAMTRNQAEDLDEDIWRD